MNCDWKTYPLGELVSFSSGGTPSKKRPEYWSGNIPWISAKTLKDERISTSDLFISEEALKVGSKLAPVGSILLLTRGSGLFNGIPIGLVESEVAFNQDIKCLNSCADIENKYIFYWLLSQKSYLMAKVGVTGIGAGKFDLDFLQKLEIPVPSKILQQQIVAIAESISQKIITNNKINENLQQQAQTLFKSWFVDFEPFGGCAPAGMQLIPLQELCTVVTKGTTPTTLGKRFTTSGINFIKAESILNNHSIDANKLSFIDDETHSLLKRSVIQSGDIVFTIAGTLGRFALIDDSVLPANTNQAVAIVRANREKITPEYLYSVFLGNWHNDYYSKRIQQAVQANLSLSTIKSLPIPVLEKDAMSEYLSLISPIISMSKAREIENAKLASLRDLLLPKIMSGKIDVSNIQI